MALFNWAREPPAYEECLDEREKGEPQESGQLSPPPCVQSPDKTAKPAFPDLVALQENEPDTGRSPMESWKQALQWCGGEGLDWEPGGLCTTASHHPPATILPPHWASVSSPVWSIFLINELFYWGAGAEGEEESILSRLH